MRRTTGCHGSARLFVRAVSISAFLIAADTVPARGAPVWTRLELIENTAEGPAFDRCQIEATLEKGETARWRVFYGEAGADSDSGWSAIRSSSGCVRVASDHAAPAWALRGSPYFQVDVALGHARVSAREVLVDAAFSIRKLSGFAQGGAPAYETRTERRTLRVPQDGGAVVPILIASPRETDQFRIRELLLKFHVSAVGARPPVAYGEIAIAADVPRAEITLDGGFAGRTSSDGPVLLHAVRAGEREIVVRDASRREARTIARVEKGHRTSLSLALLKGSPTSADGLRPLGRNPQGGEEFWREKDGAIVVRIPGGEFQMGSPEEKGEPSEHPRHAVRVHGFLIDKTEVTWGQYRRFLAASNRPRPKSPVWGTPEAFPVSGVTWDEARSFCDWAGGRLPTEAEWERAARGDDSRRFPWGDTFDPWRCNTRDGGPHAPTAAGSYPDCVSPYGVLDLAGSVSEWCSDWYVDKYDSGSPAQDPTGPETGTTHVLRGGNWMSPSDWVRVSSRQGIEPGWPGPMLGFRCGQDDRKDRK
jgi:formylglycine-generating enzyme required for sulfatase activity